MPDCWPWAANRAIRCSSSRKFLAPSGTEVAIEVRWKDAQGKIQSSPAQDWVRNVATKKALDTNWVFAGSRFVTDEETGKPQYYGRRG